MTDWIRPSALTGSTTEIVDRLGEYADAGADWVMVALRAPFDVDGLDRFASEVMPALA
jgi:alkanesulfonate monooxygenase SsuD/methylene tetrahydromethanopterin reductase-like flavin-dependent oxidoreductase (luciferase family)